MNKTKALQIHGKLLTEANRLRPKPHLGNRSITHDEVLRVVSGEELVYLLKAQQVFNNLVIERRSRGAHYYCL